MTDAVNRFYNSIEGAADQSQSALGHEPINGIPESAVI